MRGKVREGREGHPCTCNLQVAVSMLYVTQSVIAAVGVCY